MVILAQYRSARRAEEIARARRCVALRALVATGMTQRQIADALGLSQSAISQQLKSARELSKLHPADLLEAAVPVLKELAEERGYRRLAVYGSVARQEAGQNSDIDLLVEAPSGTSTFGFLRFKTLLEEVLGREVDLTSYGGLRPSMDGDVHRDMVPL